MSFQFYEFNDTVGVSWYLYVEIVYAFIAHL